jgi:hypothetical protein
VRKAAITNVGIVFQTLSISDSYLRTIEPTLSIALASLTIGESQLQKAGCLSARARRSSPIATASTAGIGM